MKKFILVILSVGMFFSTTAQKRSGFGFHAGINVSSAYDLDYGYYDDYEPLNGFQAGIRYNLKFGPLGICPEINYTSINIGKGDYAFDRNLNYLSIPLVLKVYLGGINFQFGTQVSQLLSGTFNVDDISESITSDNSYTTIDGVEYWDYEDMDIAGIVGFGIDTKRGLYFSLRSIVSLTSIANLDAVNAVYNQSFGIDAPPTVTDYLERLVSSQISVGWKF